VCYYVSGASLRFVNPEATRRLSQVLPIRVQRLQELHQLPLLCRRQRVEAEPHRVGLPAMTVDHLVLGERQAVVRQLVAGPQRP
jgi:hypothetical protein